jgi:hypothetical protein
MDSSHKEVRCPGCDISGNITSILCSSRTRPLFSACRCWTCGWLWSTDVADPVLTQAEEGAPSSGLAASPAQGR